MKRQRKKQRRINHRVRGRVVPPGPEVLVEAHRQGLRTWGAPQGQASLPEGSCHEERSYETSFCNAISITVSVFCVSEEEKATKVDRYSLLLLIFFFFTIVVILRFGSTGQLLSGSES